MRIIIDTELQVIIVPDSYYTQVDKLNEIIISAGGRKLDYNAYIKTCFDKAYASQIICQEDVKKTKEAIKRKYKNTAKAEETHETETQNE